MKKALNGLMASGVLAVLLAAMALSILRPRTENYYENRPAAALPAFSGAAARSGEYQDALELALHDQLPGAQMLEKQYRTGLNALILRAVFDQSHARLNAYYRFNDLLLFHSDIVYKPVFAEEKLGELSARVENLNLIFSAHPELSFYVFYIEKDTDMDFETGVSTGVGDTLLPMLWLPEDHMATFPVSSFEDFRARFYKTDHHWNCTGAYEGYTRVLALLGKSDPVLPEGTERITDAFCGSKAITSGASNAFFEPFDVYRFSFPAMRVTVNGKPVSDYGRQTQPWDPEANGSVSYSGYYGDDYGEVVFRTENIGAGNLLVIGESFDNAILKLLAGHFETLYAVDLRAFEEDMGTPFRFSDYVAAHNIDTVLFIGNIDYFLVKDFNVEG